MNLPEKECVHVAEVLKRAKKALLSKNSLQLKHLSNQTIHSACSGQDHASITLSVLLYALSKLTERGDYSKIRSWENFTKKFNATLDLAIKALNEKNQEKYDGYVTRARKTLESQSIAFKPYIEQILKKSEINKSSKIHEHGISIGKTSHLLGVSQWELAEYVGNKSRDDHHNQTLDVKSRAKMALEFFS